MYIRANTVVSDGEKLQNYFVFLDMLESNYGILTVQFHIYIVKAINININRNNKDNHLMMRSLIIKIASQSLPLNKCFD